MRSNRVDPAFVCNSAVANYSYSTLLLLLLATTTTTTTTIATITTTTITTTITTTLLIVSYLQNCWNSVLIKYLFKLAPWIAQGLPL